MLLVARVCRPEDTDASLDCKGHTVFPPCFGGVWRCRPIFRQRPLQRCEGTQCAQAQTHTPVEWSLRTHPPSDRCLLPSACALALACFHTRVCVSACLCNLLTNRCLTDACVFLRVYVSACLYNPLLTNRYLTGVWLMLLQSI